MSGGPKILRKWAGGLALVTVVASLSQAGAKQAPAMPVEGAKLLPDRLLAPMGARRAHPNAPNGGDPARAGAPKEAGEVRAGVPNGASSARGGAPNGAGPAREGAPGEVTLARANGPEGDHPAAGAGREAPAPTPRVGVPRPAAPGPAAPGTAPRAGAPVGRGVDCRKVQCVALTFDDGPIPGTEKLLNILKARGVRVTFFLIGQEVAKYPEVVRREVAEGHQIGNHTWDHSDLSKLSDSAMEAQLAQTQDVIKKAVGVTPVVLRPPYGSSNHRVAAMARKYKLAQVTWAVDPLDWKDHDSAKIQRRVVDGAQRDYVILMHDIQPTTVDAVPKILDELKAKGLTVVTISELFGTTPPVAGELYTKYPGTAQGLP